MEILPLSDTQGEDFLLTLTKEDVKRLALYKQGLYHTPTAATPEAARQIFEKLGCVQLDTLNVVTRSQHLIFWSRMKEFQSEWFHQFYEQGQMFEHYLHALSVLPMKEHVYMQPFLKHFQTSRVARTELHDRLLTAIHARGSLTGQQAASELDLPKTSKDTWQLSPVRRALDELWRSGEIGVVRDTKFHKVYVRIEDQVPAELLHQDVTIEETVRRYVRLALSALGAATERDVADYFRFKRETVRPVLAEFLQVRVEGDAEPYYMLPEDADLLPLSEEPTHATFLSPFDNLIWHRPRLEKIFDTEFRLESYVPQAQRKFGYFALPILVGGNLIGTIDLKAERKHKTLHINKLVLFDPAKKQEQLPVIESILHRLTAFLRLDTIQQAE
ncbi:winged helix-turn-helix domain-containing protein [Tumebacillus algifaecis]|nr:crosslink repair DNA glycosylase YcaQ family protein [Tumebacillus algifaecis]